MEKLIFPNHFPFKHTQTFNVIQMLHPSFDPNYQCATNKDAL